nr:MAG TPA: hypothetical protein [Caudoviricetes sp.]
MTESTISETPHFSKARASASALSASASAVLPP